ncbi:hypothetical protein [Actinomyces procaprae]|uniref:hypothetical protein n=1 Tax=Actinomyces procaprae TaxID=2560010 RepID=UPI00109E1A59|nr:hypothetical protein [Actinomyces procaprae]
MTTDLPAWVTASPDGLDGDTVARVLTGHRQSWWEVVLADRHGREVRPVDGVTGGQVDLSASTTLRASGTLTLTDRAQGIDWLSDRVHVYEHVRDRHGRVVSWPLGEYLLSAPTRSYTGAGSSWDVELSSPLLVLSEDALPETLTVPAGTVVTDWVSAQVSAAGERPAIEPAAATLASALVFEAGTTLLTALNEVLSAANYWALSPAPDGTLASSPYRLPADRPLAWELAEGDRAVHSATWTRDLDTAGTPNRVVCVAQGGGEDEPEMTATATNTSPDSPYSHQARGRWITHVETGVEATSQAALDAIAARRLAELTATTGRIKASCLPLPIWPRERVTWDTAGHRTSATIASVSVPMEPTALATIELEEIP